ncbi:hypothetical protein OSTOST_09421, partial [Ostertagia ostertagi]
MAYVPSSDVPSAFLISSDADAVLLDLLGTFVLLDGGSEKVLFTKHVRQIDANVISAPTKAALTNAVELNKETIVPLVGNIPTVKSAGSDGSVASLLKRIEQASEGRPVITPTRFNPKYEPIVISKSLRSGRLELTVLAGEPKEVEALQKAVESGDEHLIEKAASSHGTISVLVWFPARPSDPIKRILHTGTAPLARIINALEKARALPFLHSPVVSAANAFKEVPPPARIANSRGTVPSRVSSATVKSNSTAAAAKPAPTKRPVAPVSHVPPARITSSAANKSAPASAKPSPARPPAAAAPSNRTRAVASSAAVKHAAPTNKTGSSSNNKKTVAHEAPAQKTTVTPVKGAAMSRASAASGKAATSVVGKASGTVPSKGVPSKTNRSAPPAPVPAPAPEEVKEPAPTPVEPMPPLDDSVVILDDVVPDICVDAPQDPASSGLHSAVELHVIPPTPEPRSQSGRSSVDGPLSPALVPKFDGDKSPTEQHVLPSDDDKQANDLPSPVAADTVPPSEHDSRDGHEQHELPSPAAHEEHDPHAGHKETDKPATPSPQFETSGPTEPSATPKATDSEESGALADATGPAVPSHPVDKSEPSEPSAPVDKAEPAEPPAPIVETGGSEPTRDDEKSEPVVPSAPPLIPMPDPESNVAPGPNSEPKSDSGATPAIVEIPKTDDDIVGPASPSKPPHEHDDSLPNPPFHVDVTPAEPFVPPSFHREGQASPSDLLIDDVPEEFKGPHTPQEVGENGLLDNLEEPPKLRRISMDTDDLEKALERGAAAVADQLAQCLDSLSLSNNNSDNDDTNKKESHEVESSKAESHDDEASKKESSNPAEVARKLSQQMIEEASTPLASALASSLAEGAGTIQTAVGSAYEVSETVAEGVKDATELAQEKMKAMQTRSSLVENDGDNRPVKYEETDPVIDSVLETVATDSDRVDHALSNGGSGMENKENGKRPDHEVDEDGFRLASAVTVPHLSRPLFFELVTVPHLHGKCTLTDEQSAVEYFTNIRSANYILHSEDVSPVVLDGWLTGKKQWFRDEQKCRLIPTRHHSALLAFVTAHAAEMEEHGLVMNSSLEHNSISINTEEGREDYHMIKIEL